MARLARLPLLALLVLAAAVLGACGGSAGDSGQDPQTVLKDTFSRDRPIERGKLRLAFEVRAPGVPGLPSPLTVQLGGPFQAVKGSKVPEFDFDLDLATRDGRVSVGVISTGKEGYVKLAGRAFSLGSADLARLAPGGSGGKEGGLDLGDIGLDPRGWLKDVRDQGVTELDGEQVVHLRAGVDTEAMLGDLGGLLGQAGGGLGSIAGLGKGFGQSAEAIEKAVKDASVDIWTGERDHVLRRIRVNILLDTPGEKDGTAALELGITDQSREQAIGPPANPRPLSELTSALAALAARKLSGGTAAPQGQSYEECLAAAGTDLERAQRCEALLRTP
ncbi:MAG: hypothetical protein MUC84_05075 [Solirubrobacteraceae bacterium]|jgi:hypothetical protein|nr:hypothetical protein [Solirubrobacteraceae bacterium]MCU0313418.1 hypothetical protein [Solirubrobacteraceae bacterium]